MGGRRVKGGRTTVQTTGEDAVGAARPLETPPTLRNADASHAADRAFRRGATTPGRYGDRRGSGRGSGRGRGRGGIGMGMGKGGKQKRSDWTGTTGRSGPGWVVLGGDGASGSETGAGAGWPQPAEDDGLATAAWSSTAGSDWAALPEAEAETGSSGWFAEDEQATAWTPSAAGPSGAWTPAAPGSSRAWSPAPAARSARHATRSPTSSPPRPAARPVPEPAVVQDLLGNLTLEESESAGSAMVPTPSHGASATSTEGEAASGGEKGEDKWLIDF